jgi:DNA-binding LytR/AlgR family response regulator
LSWCGLVYYLCRKSFCSTVSHTLALLFFSVATINPPQLTHNKASFADVEIVAEAEDGLQALEILSDINVDIVFVDIQMPEMDGLEFAKKAQQQQSHIVFCTAFSEHAVDAFASNAFDYIVKPIMQCRHISHVITF